MTEAQGTDLMTKVQMASSKWTDAPEELIELRDKFRLRFGHKLPLKPMDFGATLLTANETRMRILMEAFERIYADEEFTDVNSLEQALDKSALACRHLGIENNPDIVHGKCSMEENLKLWKKVLNTMPDIAAGPEEVKLCLESILSNSEAKLTWEEFIEISTQRLFSYEGVGLKNDVPNITLDDLANLEKLHVNEMTSHERMENLKTGIGKIIGSLELPDENMDENYKSNLRELKRQGEELCEMIDDFLTFMKTNDNFNSKKSEFLLCHVDMVLKTMSQILKLHRKFIQGASLV